MLKVLIVLFQNDGRRSSCNEEVEDQLPENSHFRLNSQLHASRAQSARIQNRFPRQQSSMAEHEDGDQGGVHDLPARSPALLKTGSLRSMSLVFGEGLEDDQALESPKQHEISTNSSLGTLLRNRGSETGTPPRPVHRAHLSSDQEEMGSVRPHAKDKSHASSRLASATRKAAAVKSWVDFSPGTSGIAWANARPGTALSTAIRARVQDGSSFQKSGLGSSLSFNKSFSGKMVVMDGGLLAKRSDEQTMFWKGSSQLGYRKRFAMVFDVRDASQLEGEPCKTV